MSRTVEETRSPAGGFWGGGSQTRSETVGRSGSRRVANTQMSPLAKMFTSLFANLFFKIVVPVAVRTAREIIKSIFSGRRIT